MKFIKKEHEGPIVDDIEREEPLSTTPQLDERFENLQKILNYAMSLLMNHEQHEDNEWIEDYNKLCNRYMKDFQNVD